MARPVSPAVLSLEECRNSHSQSFRAGLADLKQYGADFGDRAAAAAIFKTDPEWHIIYLLVRETGIQARRRSVKRTRSGPKRKRAKVDVPSNRDHDGDTSPYRPEDYIWRPLRYESYMHPQDFESALFVPGPLKEEDGDDIETPIAEEEFERISQHHFVWGVKALHLYGVSRVFSPGFGNIAYLRDEAGTQLMNHHAMLVRRLKAAHGSADGTGKDAQQAIGRSGTASADTSQSLPLPAPRVVRQVGPGAGDRLLLGRAIVLRDGEWVIWWFHRTDRSASLRWSKERHVSASHAHEYLVRAAHQSSSRLLAVPELRIWGNFVEDNRDLSDAQCRSAMSLLASHYHGKHRTDTDSASDSDIGFRSESEDSLSSGSSDESGTDRSESARRLGGLIRHRQSDSDNGRGSNSSDEENDGAENAEAASRSGEANTEESNDDAEAMDRDGLSSDESDTEDNHEDADATKVADEVAPHGEGGGTEVENNDR